MKASSKRILSILLSVLIIIASLFVYSSLIRPAYSEIKNLRSETAGKMDIIDKNKGSIEQVQKLLSEYQSIAQVQEIISFILPLEQNIPRAINQVVGLADLNKLSIESVGVRQLAIKPSAQPNLVKGVGTLRFDLRLAGSYENLKMFIQNMESNMNLMDLVSLKIESGIKVKPGAGGGENFSYTMIIDSYYQAP
ncbi:MAG: hypothetical protein AAB696_01620 [Patescibacteria group bacterium]